jgi:decaprenylphospho-beta-D-ribofuranose 2-oxidase
LSAARRAACPLAFFNSLTVPVFNTVYHASVRLQAVTKTIPLYDFLFPVHNKEAYFYLFGKRGFHEYQTIIPGDTFAEFAAGISERLKNHPLPVTLASAKYFGHSRDLLRFSGTGISFGLNFPRTVAGLEFCHFLDGLMQHCNGRPNLIKDSRLSARVVAAAYPEYERFRQLLRQFDSQRLYRSELSDRLSL